MLMVAQRSKVKAPALWFEPVLWCACAGILAPDQPLRAVPPVLHQRSMRQRHSLGLKTGLSLRRRFDVSLIWLVKRGILHFEVLPDTVQRFLCVCMCVYVCHPRVIKTDVNTERPGEVEKCLEHTVCSWHCLCTLRHKKDAEPGESELKCIDRGLVMTRSGPVHLILPLTVMMGHVSASSQPLYNSWLFPAPLLQKALMHSLWPSGCKSQIWLQILESCTCVSVCVCVRLRERERQR